MPAETPDPIGLFERFYTEAMGPLPPVQPSTAEQPPTDTERRFLDAAHDLRNELQKRFAADVSQEAIAAATSPGSATPTPDVSQLMDAMRNATCERFLEIARGTGTAINLTLTELQEHARRILPPSITQQRPDHVQDARKEIALSKQDLGVMCKDTGRKNILQGHNFDLLKQARQTDRGRIYVEAFNVFIQREIELAAELPEFMTRARFMQFLDELEAEYKRIVKPHIDNLGEQVASLVREQARAVFRGEREGAERMFAEAAKGIKPEIRIPFDEFEMLVDDAVALVPDSTRVELEVGRDLASVANKDWRERGQALQTELADVCNIPREQGSLSGEECMEFLGRMRKAKAVYNEHLGKCIKRSLIDERRRLIGKEMDTLEESCLTWFGRKRREAVREESAVPEVGEQRGKVTISEQELGNLCDEASLKFPLLYQRATQLDNLLINLHIDDPRRSELCRMHFERAFAYVIMTSRDIQPIHRLDEYAALAMIDIDEAADKKLLTVSSTLIPASEITQWRLMFKQCNDAKRKAIREWFAKKRAEQTGQEAPPPISVSKSQFMAALQRSGERIRAVPQFQGMDAELAKAGFGDTYREYAAQDSVLQQALPEVISAARAQQYLKDLYEAEKPLRKFVDQLSEPLRVLHIERLQVGYATCKEEVEKLFTVPETKTSTPTAAETPRTERTVKSDAFVTAVSQQIAQKFLSWAANAETRQLLDTEPATSLQHYSAAIARVTAELARLPEGLGSDPTYGRCQRYLADLEGALYPARAAAEGFRQELRTKEQKFLHDLYQAAVEAVEELFREHQSREQISEVSSSEQTVPLTRATLEEVYERTVRELQETMEKHGVTAQSEGLEGSAFRVTQHCTQQGRELHHSLPETITDPTHMAKHLWEMFHILEPVMEATKVFESKEAFRAVFSGCQNVFCIAPAQEMLRHLEGTRSREILTSVDLQCLCIVALSAHYYTVLDREGEGVKELDKALQRLAQEEGKLSETYPEIIGTYAVLQKFMEEQRQLFEKHIGPHLKNVDPALADFVREQHPKQYDSALSVILKHYALEGAPPA